MFERIFDWVGDLLVDFLFGALYKVLYVSTLPKTTRYILAALVIAVYSAIEIFLIYEAVSFSRTGKESVKHIGTKSERQNNSAHSGC